MKTDVRVRFAPSPTGPLHIGGVRTALYNYLFAKKHKGTFILRIEDTDQTRYVANAEKYIIDSLNWCGIPFDEGPNTNEKFGPYRQSERKEIYKKYADELIANGKAYYAFDTQEALDFHRKQHEEQGKTFIYNWHNREKGKLENSLVLSADEVNKRIQKGDDYVIRFKTPENRTLSLFDEVRGEIKIDTNTLDDKILYKSDGMPTYHLANVVDDHLMEISHVIRGEEWLPSLALHNLLYEAFDWKAPKFAHLPLLLKPTGKGKLSKRDGDALGFPVFPLAYTNLETGEVSRGYKEDGYFADAFLNMLALLGWNPGTEQEIFNLDELIDAFDLKRIIKSGAKFNLDKTKWFQQQYMQTKNDAELANLFQGILKEKNIEKADDFVQKVISLVKERAVFVTDFWNLASYFFETPSIYDEKAILKSWKDDTAQILTTVRNIIQNCNEFTSQYIENKVKEYITNQNIGFGKVMQPLRIAIVGELKGPHLFDIIELIGKEETLKRVQLLLDKNN